MTHRGGDLDGVDEDRLHRPLGVVHGLVGEVDEDLLGPLLVQERCPYLPAHNLLPGGIDLVQQVEETLLAHLGEGLLDSTAQHRAPADQAHVFGVGELEDVVWSHQQRHCRRQVVQDTMKATERLAL